MRICDLAKELMTTGKELLALLQARGCTARSTQANLTPDLEQYLRDEIKRIYYGGAATPAPAAEAAAPEAAPAAPATEADPKQPQGATSPDFSALTAAITASFETAMTPMRQKLDEMDKRFAAAKPGAPVAETTGPADENTPLI